MSQMLDTEPWAEQMQLEWLRRAGPARRLELTFQLSAAAWTMARAAIDRLHPEETEDQRDLRFLSTLYGDELAARFITYRQAVLGPRNQKVTR